MATITLHPSQAVTAESAYDSVGVTANLNVPVGKGITNTSYAEVYMTTGKQEQTYVTYRFDASSIPADATISKVSLKVKVEAETEGTARISITRVSLLSGNETLAKSSDNAYGQDTTVVEVSANNVARSKLDDAKLQVFAQRGNWYANRTYFVRFYGADLVVEYTGDQPTPDPDPPKPPDPEPEPGPEPTPTDKTHAALIDGTTYSVLGGRALINGTGVDIKGGRALVNGTGVDILFDNGAGDYAPEFEDNTWEQIIDACQRNAVPNTWVTGNNKLMTIGGTEYQIDIIGIKHDTYTSGGKAPLTFQLHDCHTERKSMENGNSNSNGWQDCAMRKTHLPDFLSQMPTKVQSSVREVNKLTSEGAQSDYIVTTADKLFLLSEIEIFGKAAYSASGEGTQYKYYADGNSVIKNRDGGVTDWWERSPKISDIASYCRVFSNGQNYSGGASGLIGVSFAFCF